MTILAARAATHAPSTPAPCFSVLPEGMQRSQVEALLVEVASAIGLSGARLQALLVMIGYTRPQAWVDPTEEPVCYASQVEVAAALGITERRVRAAERDLSARLGLLDKRTAANGGRSRAGSLGLVFSRLVELVPRLIALRDQRRAERARVQTLARLRSSHFRHLRDGLAMLHAERPDDVTLKAIRDAVLAWPPSGALRGMGLAALEAHVAETRALCDALDAVAAETRREAAEASRAASDGPETSGREDGSVRSLLQATTKEPLDFWSSEQEEDERDGRPSPTRRPRAEGEDENRAERASRATERQDAFAARLGPQRLYELAGEDFRLCLDMTGRPPERLRERDVVDAAITLLPALGISGDAWREAAEAMGDLRAALCVLVTDANRDHPATPIRKPGGHLRALTQRHRGGQLNLVGSLIGLAERRDGA